MFNFIKNLRTDNEKTKLQKELEELRQELTSKNKKINILEKELENSELLHSITQDEHDAASYNYVEAEAEILKLEARIEVYESRVELYEIKEQKSKDTEKVLQKRIRQSKADTPKTQKEMEVRFERRSKRLLDYFISDLQNEFYPVIDHEQPDCIILDTNIIINNEYVGLGESEFDATSLGKLLNLITENKCCTPILSKTLRGEYATQLENERDRHGQKNISNFWLQSYPVDPLGKFLGQCKEMLLNSMEGDLPETPSERKRRKRRTNKQTPEQRQRIDHFTKNFEKHRQHIINSLTPEERKELKLDDEKRNGKNDINIAAMTKLLDAKLVTEDKGLLRLKNNQEIKLNVYPLHDPEVKYQFNNSIFYILDSELKQE